MGSNRRGGLITLGKEQDNLGPGKLPLVEEGKWLPGSFGSPSLVGGDNLNRMLEFRFQVMCCQSIGPSR